MATTNANVFYPVPEAHPHAYPAVAEPGGQYRTAVKGEAWSRELQRIEWRALRTAASGQIARLHQLTNLLLQPAPADRPAAELEALAQEIRQATGALEDTLHTILDPLTEEPEPGEDAE
jgi:hypothetical protein